MNKNRDVEEVPCRRAMLLMAALVVLMSVALTYGAAAADRPDHTGSREIVALVDTAPQK